MKGNLDVGGKFIRSQEPEDVVSTGFVDSGLAGGQDEGNSTIGYIFYVVGGPLGWRSQRQPMVALSTGEAEHLALSKIGNQCMNLRHLMSTVGCEQKTATTLNEHN